MKWVLAWLLYIAVLTGLYGAHVATGASLTTLVAGGALFLACLSYVSAQSSRN